MQLVYTSADETTIQATLEDGETLGNIHGPAVVFVPADPSNAEYAAIIEGGYPIEPYVPPPEPEREPTKLEANPQAPMDAATKLYVDSSLADTVTPLIERIEALERR